jgi:hypothetical protein
LLRNTDSFPGHHLNANNFFLSHYNDFFLEDTKLKVTVDPADHNLYSEIKMLASAREETCSSTMKVIERLATDPHKQILRDSVAMKSSK